MLQTYRKQIQSTIETLHSEKKANRLKQQSKLVQDLEESLKQCLDQIGTGYKNASQFHQSLTQQNQNLRDKLIEASQVETTRYLKAVDCVSNQVAERERREHLTKLKQVRQVENQRAHNMAQMYRLTHPDADPLFDFKVDSKKLERRRDRVNANRNVRFDDSYFHRDYTAVRAEQPSVLANNNNNNGNKSNATIMAGIVKQELLKQQNAAADRMKEYENRAQIRFDKAIYATKMQAEREKMIEELEKVQINDRRRKQLLLDANSRPSIVVGENLSSFVCGNEGEQMRQHVLEKFFEKKFGNSVVNEPVISRVPRKDVPTDSDITTIPLN